MLETRLTGFCVWIKEEEREKLRTFMLGTLGPCLWCFIRGFFYKNIILLHLMSSMNCFFFVINYLMIFLVTLNHDMRLK